MNLIAATVQAATGCTPTLAALYAPHLSDACVAYGITTTERLAAFLAQIGHESGSLKFTAELWGPTPAQSRYEGRADLGNNQVGDGHFFKGRGLIQVTGRFNHVKCRDRLRLKLGEHQVPDFERVPEALEQPRWAAWSAAEYWASHGCNELADAGEFEAITIRINGALNGQPDRLERWEKAKAALGVQPGEAPAKPVETAPEVEQDEAPRAQKGFTVAPILAALLPSLVSLVPKLGALFGSGSDVAQRNVKAVELAFGVAKDALQATNEQEVIAKIQSDPAAAAVVSKAIEDNWFALAEAGGGGIDGARKADAVTSGGDIRKSPSFWIGIALLPILYLFVLSLIGAIGSATWSDDVRAGLAGSITSAILGGLVGYYFGQTTSRNRTPST